MASRSSTLFDRWSATYDRPSFQNATYRPVHDAVLRRLVDDRPEVVLDLGCGTGHLTRRLQEKFPDAQIIGVDSSNGMLGEASDRLGVGVGVGVGNGVGVGARAGAGAQLVQADAQRLPLQVGSVDAVVCTESFHWYPDQARAAAGLAEVLRPGGQLLIASIAAVTDIGEVAVRRLSRSGGQPIRALTPRHLRRLLDRAGFEVVAQLRVPRAGLVPWPVLTDARRR